MFFRFMLLVNFCILSLSLTAQRKAASITQINNKDQSLGFFDYMITDSISEINLIADFSTIRKNRYKEDYYKGQLQFYDKDSSYHNFNVVLRTRGKSRKKVCYYPPLKLKFSKNELEANGFSTTNKYKLVCQCKPGKAHKQSLFREYMAYKIYNLISPNSFRVHLFKLNYKEVSTRKEESHYGFILEPEKDLENRLQSTLIDREEIEMNKISRAESLRLSIFQYMIANTDWNIIALHNVKLLLNKQGVIIPIPYDYDYSGLADTPYATPNPDYKLGSVRDRHFLSDDYTKEEIYDALPCFQEQEEVIETLITNFDLFSNRSKRHTLRFIREFYKTIKNPRSVSYELVRD